MAKIRRVLERCYCCTAERVIMENDVELFPLPWPVVSAPGAFPDCPQRHDRLGLCPDCHAKVTEPIVFAGDLERQLGFVPRIFVDFDVDKTAPFWDEFKRAREVK